MTKLIFVRHGETIWNQEYRYQGQKDSPLSSVGLKQIKQLGEFLQHKKIDAVYSSDLPRAVATAEAVAKHHGLTPKVDSRLREMAFGVWEGLTRNEILTKYPELFAARYQDSLNTRIPEGELPTEVIHRFSDFLTDCLENHCEQTLVVVSHGGTLRFAISYLLQMPLELSYCIRLANAGISEFVHSKKGTQCVWEVVALNSCGHLS